MITLREGDNNMGRRKNPPQANGMRQIAESLRRERPDLDPADYLHIIYIRRLGRLLDRLDHQFCQQRFGISGADMRLLRVLRIAGAPYALRPTELFRTLLVTSGAVTKQVDRLAGLGFVERRPDPSHAGGFLIQLTERGVAIANEAITVLGRVFPTVGAPSPLGARERRALASLCEKVLVAIEGRVPLD